MFHPAHKSYIKSLYKNILSEASLFFDDRSRHFIKTRARTAFKEYKTCEDLDRIKYKLRETRKKLHRLEDANRGDRKSALKILQEAYGRRGKVRHALLSPYLNHHQPSGLPIYHKPFVAHAPRTAPPPELCPPLKSIITQHLGKKLEPDLPQPEYKPLHVGRKANLLWRHRSMLLDRLEVPLPFEIVCELEQKAGAPVTHPLACSTRVTGGPRWYGFYSALTSVIQQMPHLMPHLQPSPASRLIRTQPLPLSPYATPNLLLDPEPKTQSPPVSYQPRQQKRLYQRLLTTVPLIDCFLPSDLWSPKSYSVSKSHWTHRGVTRVLQDIPTQQVIDSTLASTKKKSVRRSM